jgi:hypothetical protein
MDAKLLRKPEPTTDADALDRLARYLATPGDWNGGDVCEYLADTVRATGRPNPDTVDDGAAFTAYCDALAARRAADGLDAAVAAAANTDDLDSDEEVERLTYALGRALNLLGRADLAGLL